MARVVIVGEIYNADLSIGGGPIIPPLQPTHPWVPPTGGSPPYPDQGLPPGQPGVPSHPIVIPPDAIEPGLPSHPIYIPVYPGHPIVIPPDGLAPGVPTHPIYLPVYPSHPIMIPPDAISPGVPTHPIVLPEPGVPTHPIAGPPNYPSHPIVIPPEAIVPDTEGKAHVVVYFAGQRVTFTVEMPEQVPPTEPEPK